jgi:hypothetical protein
VHAAVIIKDDVVAFNPNIIKPNELNFKVDIDCFYTKFGFFMPLHYEAMSFLDYIDTEINPTSFINNGVKRVILIDYRGVVRYISFGIHVDEKGSRDYFSSTRIPTFKDMQYIRSFELQDELVLEAALKLKPTLKEAIELYGKVLLRPIADYQFLKIKDIASNLVKLGYSSSFVPVKQKIES